MTFVAGMPSQRSAMQQQSAPAQPPPGSDNGDVADGGAARITESGLDEQPQLQDDPQAAAMARSGGGDPGLSLHPPETLASA